MKFTRTHEGWTLAIGPFLFHNLLQDDVGPVRLCCHLSTTNRTRRLFFLRRPPAPVRVTWYGLRKWSHRERHFIWFDFREGKWDTPHDASGEYVYHWNLDVSQESVVQLATKHGGEIVRVRLRSERG